MSTKEELTTKVEELTKSKEELTTKVEELTKKIESLNPDEEEVIVEETVKLYWPHVLDPLNPTAYGIHLTADGEGNMFANVPESLSEIELSREGCAFTKDKPVKEEE